VREIPRISQGTPDSCGSRCPSDHLQKGPQETWKSLDFGVSGAPPESGISRISGQPGRPGGEAPRPPLAPWLGPPREAPWPPWLPGRSLPGRLPGLPGSWPEPPLEALRPLAPWVGLPGPELCQIWAQFFSKCRIWGEISSHFPDSVSLKPWPLYRCPGFCQVSVRFALLANLKPPSNLKSQAISGFRSISQIPTA